MMKNTCVLFSLFAFTAVFAQEVEATQGDSYSNAGASIHFTRGEVNINRGTDGIHALETRTTHAKNVYRINYK